MTHSIAVYVDGQHLYHAAKNAGLKLGIRGARPDYDAVMTRALREAGELLGVDWRKIEVEAQVLYSTSKNRTTAFEKALEQFGYQVRSYLLKSETDSFDWDVRIACDVLRDVLKPRLDALDEVVKSVFTGTTTDELTDELTAALSSSSTKSIDLVVLVTGDGDFAHLVDELEHYNVSTLVLGFPGSTSSKFAGSKWLGRSELYGE